MESESQNTQAVTSHNNNFDQSTIIKRIDPSDLLESIKVFLQGSIGVWTQDNEGNTIYKQIEEGTPRANKRGVQSIMSRLSLIFNTQTVQGNLKEEQYYNIITYTHESFADSLMDNRENWEISITDYEEILDSIMVSVRCYLSRLLGNKERESYAQTIKTLESNTLQNKSGLGLFK